MGKGCEGSLRFSVEGLSHPRADMPYYHARCRLSVGEGIRITGASGGLAGEEGKSVRFRVIVEGEKMEGGVVPGGSEAQVLVRCDWQPGKTYQVQLAWKEEGQEEAGEPVKALVESPGEGGYWDARWKNYRPIVVRETQGLERQLEPVDVSVALRREEVTDLARELRLVEVDPETGEQREIPSQPNAVVPYEPAVENAGQASVRCNIAFLASVPAHGSKIYLAFHDNCDAAAPRYETDLQVIGEGEGAAWENSLVRYQFQKGCGQLLEIILKDGAEKKLRHGRGRGATMHWNPDCYQKPRPWAYTHNWNIPQTGQMSEIRGPIFLQSTRWGALEPNMPEVEGWVTYRLYAHNPELRMSSLMEVVQDISVHAIRNDEIVQDTELVTHYAFEEKNGKVTSGAFEGGAKQEHVWVGPLELDVPWVCLYSPEGGHGLATVHLGQDFGHRYGKPASTDKAGTYITWTRGSIAYWFRAYVLELWKDRPLLLEKGAWYSETNGYLPCKMDARTGSLQRLRKRAKSLRYPLATTSEGDM